LVVVGGCTSRVVTTERRVDLIEVAMLVSVSLMGIGQLSFD
jgi:hypothetical protein